MHLQFPRSVLPCVEFLLRGHCWHAGLCWEGLLLVASPPPPEKVPWLQMEHCTSSEEPNPGEPNPGLQLQANGEPEPGDERSLDAHEVHDAAPVSENVFSGQV